MTERGMWKAEAVKLRDQGLTKLQIAQTLGVNYHTLRSYLERHDTQINPQLGKGIKRHEIRIPRKSEVDTMGLARMFAAGKIDRAELSRRLRGGA